MNRVNREIKQKKKKLRQLSVKRRRGERENIAKINICIEEI